MTTRIREEMPPCPNCECPTMTMRDQHWTLRDGRERSEYSCDACGHGWTVITEPQGTLDGPRDVTGFVGGSEY